MDVPDQPTIFHSIVLKLTNVNLSWWKKTVFDFSAKAVTFSICRIRPRCRRTCTRVDLLKSFHTLRGRRGPFNLHMFRPLLIARPHCRRSGAQLSRVVAIGFFFGYNLHRYVLTTQAAFGH